MKTALASIVIRVATWGVFAPKAARKISGKTPAAKDKGTGPTSSQTPAAKDKRTGPESVEEGRGSDVSDCLWETPICDTTVGVKW